MDEPFYIRPEDYLYCLTSNAAYGWKTGVTADGRQVLYCGGRTFLFTATGELLESIGAPPDFTVAPIHVRRFWLPEHSTGIEDLPEGLKEYCTDPDEFEGDDQDAELWIEAGQFAFYDGYSGEFILGPEGKVISS